MTERGMIFNGEMVRAILDGRKTQTRRIMTVQPESSEFGLRYIAESSLAKEVGMYFWSQSDACGMKARSKPFACPYGKPGDRIWVRETWSSDFANYYPNDRVWYAADNNRRLDIEVVDGVRGIYSPESDVHVPFRWRPSIHMPRWASRILLEITNVRVERLKSISDGDAIREGCSTADMKSGDCVADVFARLWASIYGSDSWNANPWVWVISFERIEGGAA
ncbi:morphogenetic protein [Klebsiella variicola]|uniref:morphogenetic protein n=1 Tax=Klebsiella variicola TaxID=244366 RepID=UPI00312FE48C